MHLLFLCIEYFWENLLETINSSCLRQRRLWEKDILFTVFTLLYLKFKKAGRITIFLSSCWVPAVLLTLRSADSPQPFHMHRQAKLPSSCATCQLIFLKIHKNTGLSTSFKFTPGSFSPLFQDILGSWFWHPNVSFSSPSWCHPHSQCDRHDQPPEADQMQNLEAGTLRLLLSLHHLNKQPGEQRSG